MGELISFSERRNAQGLGCVVPARIERDAQPSLRCVLVGISRLGACLSAPAIALPDLFVLKLPDTSRYLCEVVWRKDHTVGVAFLKIDQLLAQTARATAKLKRSCARASITKRTADEIA